jgi:uncharacterized protein
MNNSVSFFEVISADAPRAQRFYADLFGWKVVADPEMDGYALVQNTDDAAPIGGIGPWTEPGSGGVKVYVQVDDLEAALKRAVELGGKQLVPPTDLPGDYGRFAMFADPDGNPVGLSS